MSETREPWDRVSDPEEHEHSSSFEGQEDSSTKDDDLERQHQRDPEKDARDINGPGFAGIERRATVEEQIEVEAGNAIKYRTCSWEKARMH